MSSQPDYELDDFTAVSEWERFTASMEECLREWSTNSTSPSITAATQQQLESPFKNWLMRSCDLGSVSGQRFELIRFYHETVVGERAETPDSSSSVADSGVFLDLLDARNDFDTTHNPEPFKMFGFHDFGVLRTRQASTVSNNFVSIQTSKLLLSSVASAANSSNCSLPILLEIPSSQQQGRMGYSGISVSRVALVDLNALIFNPPSRPPTHMSTVASGHLCYWIAVMRNHLRCPLWPQPPLQLAVRYSYYIRIPFPQYDVFTADIPDLDDDQFFDDGSPDIDSLDDYEDGFAHSRGSLQRKSSASSLGELIYPNFFNLPFGIYDPTEAAFEVILKWPALDDSQFSDSPVISSSDALDLVNGASNCRGCILDPATATDWSAKLWLQNKDITDTCSSHGLLADSIDGFFKMTSLKSSPSDSSSVSQQSDGKKQSEDKRSNHWSMRIVKQIATATANAAGQLAPSSVLPELIRAMVDNFVFSPKSEESGGGLVEYDVRDLKAAPSDSLLEFIAIGACVLNTHFGQSAPVQFWQLICHRLQHHWEVGKILPRVDQQVPPDLKQSLLSQKLQLLAYCIGQRLKRQRDVTTAGSSPKKDISGDGRLRLLNPKTKLQDDSDFIYVPETQEPEPVTEDELPMFPTELRDGVGMQHSIPCLESDMASFKAANPGAQLIDFLQWYSPRDVKTDDNGNVALSHRMMIPDNIWISTWEKVKPLPARRQKRLFDETKAAHSCLRWFSALGQNSRELTFHLLPIALGAALRRVKRELKTVTPLQQNLHHVPSFTVFKESVDKCSEAVVKATLSLGTMAVEKMAEGCNHKSSLEFEFGDQMMTSQSSVNENVQAAIDTLEIAERQIFLLQSLRTKLGGAISAGDGHVLDEFLANVSSNCSKTYNGTLFPEPLKSPVIIVVALLNNSMIFF